MTSLTHRKATKQSRATEIHALRAVVNDLEKRTRELAAFVHNSAQSLCETFDAELKSRPTTTEVVELIDRATRPKKAYDAPVTLSSAENSPNSSVPEKSGDFPTSSEGPFKSVGNRPEFSAETVPTNSEGAE